MATTVVAASVGSMGVAVTAASAADPAPTPDLATVLAANAAIRRTFAGAGRELPGRVSGGPSGGGLAASGAPPTGGTRILGFDEVAVGAAHTCVITLFSDVWCFGDNGSGQLGNGNLAHAAGPVRVSATGLLAKRITTSVTAGRAHTCSLTGSATDPFASDVYCWGANNAGQLGDGTLATRTRPVKVLKDVAAVAAGQEHTCAVLSAGTVSCWGRNDVGQLGLGTIGGVHDTPQRVPGLTGVVGISADDNNTCALVGDTPDGPTTAWCWGSDTHGQLGDGHVSGTPSSSPVAVVMTGIKTGFMQIDVGRRHACAVDGLGAAYCWGSDVAGQLGNGSASGNVSTPAKVVAGKHRLFSVTAGDASSCAVDSAGQAYCWGDNADGRLGVGDRTDRAVPTAVDQRAILPSPIMQLILGTDTPMLAEVAVGGGHACAVDPQGVVYCWGDNAAGQLGVAGAAGADVPTPTVLTPGPPTGVRVRPGEKSLTVSWRAPADSGAAPVIDYAALAIHGTGADAINDIQICDARKRLHCVIKGVAGGRRYAVFVGVATRGGASYSMVTDATPTSAGAGGGLPVTGTETARYLVVGATLVAVGGLLLLSGRRRRRGVAMHS